LGELVVRLPKQWILLERVSVRDRRLAVALLFEGSVALFEVLFLGDCGIGRTCGADNQHNDADARTTQGK